MNNALLIENVPEYKEAVVLQELPPTWLTKSCVIDPRLFGFPASRSRIYLIAWDPEAVSWRADVQVEDVVEALTSFVTRDASIFFWKQLPKSNLSGAQALWPQNELKTNLSLFRFKGWLCLPSNRKCPQVVV